MKIELTLELDYRLAIEVEIRGDSSWIAMRSRGRFVLPSSDKELGNVSAAELRFSRAFSREELAYMVADHVCKHAPLPLRQKAQGIVARFLTEAKSYGEEIHDL